MTGSEKIIYVYSGWSNTLVLIGRLYVNDTYRGKESSSFEYDKEWIRSAEAQCMLDPDLHLYEGRQYTHGKPLFGVFSDSCPDRWGRLLLKRKEQHDAKKENRKPRALNESDYLLGVCDITRLGALRFATEADGPFLAIDDGTTVPLWTTLRTLEAASARTRSRTATKPTSVNSPNTGAAPFCTSTLSAEIATATNLIADAAIFSITL